MSDQPQTGSEALLERLDYLTRVIEVAFAPQIEATRLALREDSVEAAIIDAAAGEWKSAGKLRQQVEKRSSKGKRTVQDRIAHLTDRGYLEKRGAGPSTEYRTNPVIAA